MPNNRPINAAEVLAASILTAFLAGMGWLTLLQGGITLHGKSGANLYVSGGAGIAVGLSFFAFAALSSLLLSRALQLSRLSTIGLLLCLLLPPLIYLQQA